MRGRSVAVVLVAVVLIVSGLGYLIATSLPPPTQASGPSMTTQPPRGIMQCIVSQYAVYQVTYTGSNTGFANSTETTALETYLTTTTQTQTIGYVTAFTTSYTTYTGVLALENVTSCQYISG